MPLFHQLFLFTTGFCNFQFESINYDQIDGLSMGNPLAPPLAHLFMVRIETATLSRALQEQKQFAFKPLTWLRYVDDVYGRISKRDSERLPEILNFLNSIHKSIKFTAKCEQNKCLNFLEVSCSSTKIRNGCYEMYVYQKPTHTNLYVAWDSGHPASQKIGIFRMLLHRAKQICSSMNYEQEKQQLISIFQQNGYPKNRLLSEIQRFENTTRTKAKRDESTVALSIPYMPGVSEKNLPNLEENRHTF